ncbi:MAG: RNA polymerase sigma factor [Actinomycetota bacterium]
MEAREGLAQAIRRVNNAVRPLANGHTEDVVQEALVRAIKSGVSPEAEQWLKTVARRVAIDEHRKDHETPSGAAVELEKWLQSREPDPEEAYIRAERSQAVRDALAELPPRYREALLAFAEEDSPAAVAKTLGLSASATWTLLSRARSRLKLQLEQVGFVPALLAAKGRFRELIAVGAAAGVAAVAATATLTTPSVLPAPAPQIAQVADTVEVAPVEDTGVEGASTLPVDTTAVTDNLDEVKETTTTTVANIGVECVITPRLPLEAGVTLEDRPESSIVVPLIKLVPEKLRVLPDVNLCRR